MVSYLTWKTTSWWTRRQLSWDPWDGHFLVLIITISLRPWVLILEWLTYQEALSYKQSEWVYSVDVVSWQSSGRRSPQTSCCDFLVVVVTRGLLSRAWQTTTVMTKVDYILHVRWWDLLVVDRRDSRRQPRIVVSTNVLRTGKAWADLLSLRHEMIFSHSCRFLHNMTEHSRAYSSSISIFSPMLIDWRGGECSLSNSREHGK